MTHPRAVLAVVAAVAAAMLAGPTADGRIVFKEHFTFTDSHIEQEEHGDEFCPNVVFPVLFETEVRGLTLVKTKGGSPFLYFADNFKFNESYTNLDNGLALRLLGVGRNADQRIVDNGDGTISITVKFVGRTRVIGPDGSMLFLDSGQFRFRVLIDYGGTPGDPSDDVELGFEVLKEVGHAGTEGRDFCEDLEIFLS